MNLLLRAFRRLGPRFYVKMNIDRVKRDIRKLETAGQFSSGEDKPDIRNYAPYYRSGDFGHELFRHEFRQALIKAVREREPIYRKERREIIDLWVKRIAAIIGILGAAIGLFTVIRR